jgi:hypothetical protein
MHFLNLMTFQVRNRIMEKIFSSKVGYFSTAMLMVVVVFLANIAQSFTAGRLSGPPTFDDVTYLLSGLDLLDAYRKDSLAGLIAQIIQTPPHAPLESITAFLGFMIFGVRPVSAYLADIWYLSVYAIFILHIGEKLSDNRERLLLLALYLLIPAGHALVNEFRPDMMGGLLFAIALYHLFFELPKVIAPKTSFWSSLLVFSALIAKPSALVMTLPVLGLAILLSGAILMRCHGLSCRTVCVMLLKRLLPAWTSLILFLLIWGRDTFEYIHQALVSNADIWKTEGDRWFHFFYHSFGGGGSKALSALFLPFLIAILFRLFDNRGDKFETLGFRGYAGVLLLVYFGMSSSAEKTIFQGNFFYFPFLTLACRGLVDAAVSLRQRLPQHVLKVCLLIVILGIMRLPLASTYYELGSAFKLNEPAYEEIVSELSRYVDRRNRTYGCGMKKYTLVDTNPDIYPGHAYVFGVRAMGGNIIEDWTYFDRDFESARRRVEAADVVVITTVGPLSQTRNLPGSAFVESLQQFLLSRPDFRRLEVRADAGLKQVYLKTCSQW